MYEINHHINILKENKIPKNNKGDEYKLLEYVLDSEDIMNELLDALIENTQFYGKLILHSEKSYFSNSIGFKIGTLLSKDNLESLIVNNKDSPFSDRISAYIGESIANLKNLKRMEVYLDIGELSYNKILSFLLNENSGIECLKCLKISEDFLIQVMEYTPFIKSLNLKTLEFYYCPFTELNLMYKSSSSKGFIDTDVYRRFSDFLQLLPNLTYCKVISWFNMEIKKNISNDDVEKRVVKNNSFFSIPTVIDESITYEDFMVFNNDLSSDIDRINITFEFACKLNVDKKSLLKDTDIMFTNEHSKMCKIM